MEPHVSDMDASHKEKSSPKEVEEDGKPGSDDGELPSQVDALEENDKVDTMNSQRKEQAEMVDQLGEMEDEDITYQMSEMEMFNYEL